MKARTAILITLAACLFLGSVASAQSDEPDSLTWYTVEQGTASGGSYHLTSLSWQVDGTASSSRYRLLGPASPTLGGNPCCCTYLPCVLRNFQ